jgi:hypothetical protein
MSSNGERQSAVDFAECVRENQRRRRSNLKSHYDFIVVGQAPLARWWRATWQRIQTLVCSCSKQATPTMCQA